MSVLGMASGDQLIDSDGNELVNPDGTLAIDDGTDCVGCCGGGPYSCNFCSVTGCCIPTRFKLSWVISGYLDPTVEAVRSGSATLSQINSGFPASFASPTFSTTPIGACFDDWPDSWRYPLAQVGMSCGGDAGAKFSFGISIPADGHGTVGLLLFDFVTMTSGDCCALTRSGVGPAMPAGENAIGCLPGYYVGDDTTVEFTADFTVAPCCNIGGGACNKATIDCDDGTCEDEEGM